MSVYNSNILSISAFLCVLSYGAAILTNHYGHKSYQTYDPRAIGGYGHNTYRGNSYGGFTGSYGYGNNPYGSSYGHNSYGFGRSAKRGYEQRKPTGLSYQKKDGYDFYDTKHVPKINNNDKGSHYSHGSSSGNAYGSTKGSSYGSGSHGYQQHKPSYQQPKQSYSLAKVASSALSYKPSSYSKPTSYKSSAESSGKSGFGHGFGHFGSHGNYGGGHSHGGYPYDPCSKLPEGDYVLEGQFRGLFPYADPQCNFIKCSNYKAYVNPCAIGTKNDAYGKGFCYYHDHHRYCGYPPKKKY